MNNSPKQDERSAEMDCWMATAYHEAGHAVMALTLGRTIQKVTIGKARMPAGQTRLGACELQKGRRASKDWLEDEVLILLAGMIAESHFTGEYCTQGASQDMLAAGRLIESRAGGERQFERLKRRLIDKTEHILSDAGHAKAIELVAQELVQKRSLSGRAVRHFFQQCRD